MKISGVLFLLFFVAVSYAQIPTDSLIAYYPFNGNANDESGNNHNGVGYNTASSTDRFGIAGRSFQFNGTDSKVTVTNFPVLTDNFSYSCWIKIIGNNWNNNIQSFGMLGTHYPQQTWNLGYDNVDRQWDLWDTTPDSWYTDYSSFISDNLLDWTHVVVVYSANMKSWYVNGILLNSKTVALPLAYGGDNTLIIGNFPQGTVTNEQAVNGDIDDIRIYNRALSDSEIQELYHENGYMAPSISGKIFHDLNSDGIINDNEWGLQEWKVRITGAKVDSTTTALNGSYEFNSLPFGSYTVSVEILGGWTQTQPTAPYTYSITITDTGALYTACDFGVRRPDGLMAYYPFNGNANDESGNGRDGTLDGPTSTTDRFGNPNNALSFDGVDDKVFVDVSKALVNLGQSEYTICGWFSSANLTKELQTVFNTIPHNGISVGFNHRNFLPNHISYYIGPGIGAWISWAAGLKSNYLADKWYFFTVRKSGTNYRFYIDAMKDDERNIPEASTYDYFVGCRIGFIGEEYGSGGEYFLGKLDDYRIYNRALSNSEILELYHEGGPITSINGMKFNDLNGNGIKDPNESGLANWKINLSGSDTIHTFTDNNGNYSFKFLPMGNYTITEDNRFGWAQTFPETTAYFITIDHEDSITGIDFGNYHYQGSITGKIFDDLDGNAILDEGESGLAGWIVHIMPGNLYATTDSGGNYTFRNLPPGTYTIEQYSKQYWVQTYPLEYSNNIVSLASDEAVTNIHFGNQLMRNIYDLGVSVSAGVARPGFTQYYGIMYQNKGTENIDATVSFIHPQNTEFIQGSASPTQTSYDLGTRTLQWHVGQTIPGTIGFISAAVTIMPPPIVNIGDVLTACTTIDPVSGDATPGDNQACVSQIVTGSYDPNDKLVTPAGDGPDHEVPVGTQFEYTVRFQNTGTDTAFSVVVRDTLDPDLLISTLELGASSHPYTFELSGEGELKWTFTNINLPDSNRNEPKSHGFLSYRIRPRGNGVGATIENKASIYFDYNLPVQTNIVSNLLASEGLPSWNIISVPSVTSDYRKTHLYPTAVSNAFAYENSYVDYDILKNGVGYWLKLPASSILPSPGLNILTDTIEVMTGWNLIGSISEPVDVSTIASIPGGIMTSTFFGYATSYVLADSIYPGRGYWVKVDQPGSLILSSIPLLSSANRIQIKSTDELPPPPPSEEQVSQIIELPDQFYLFNAYPNPFNPTTVISYSLPVDCRVTLKIYNLLGQEVKTLVNEYQDAGNKSVEWNASASGGLPSGVYIYRLNADKFTDVKKLILMK